MESGRNVSMYSSNENSQDTSNVNFEPLPDILAKTVSSRALRPRISSANSEKQAAAAKLVSEYLTVSSLCSCCFLRSFKLQ